MAFGVATNNRFDLFIDDEGDPDEFVSKQQQQAETDRARRDSEKKSLKQKPGVKDIAASRQAPQSTVSTKNFTQKNTNDVTSHPAVRRDAGRGTQLERNTATPNQPAARQEQVVRERSDINQRRGGPAKGSGSAYRGRGRGHGGVSGNNEDGFDRFGKREFERHSGSDKTGLKPVEKRAGTGAHNWGSITDTGETEIKMIEEDVEQRMTMTGRQQQHDIDYVVPDTGDDVEQQQQQLTLDEWKAMQNQQRAKLNLTIRKPGEGCKVDPKWKRMQLLKKKDEEPQNGQFDNYTDEEPTVAKPKPNIPIAITFTDADQHGAGSQRGQGRGRGRGGTQQQRSSYTQPSATEHVPNVDSEKDFPSLS